MLNKVYCKATVKTVDLTLVYRSIQKTEKLTLDQLRALRFHISKQIGDREGHY